MRPFLTVIDGTGPTRPPTVTQRPQPDEVCCYFTRAELTAIERALHYCAQIALEQQGNQRAADAAMDLAYKVTRYGHPSWGA